MKNNIILLVLFINFIYGDYIRDDIKKTVLDTNTNLMWKDRNEDNTIKKTWQESINYCENLDFSGYSDWRLPNINELLSIVYNKEFDPAVNKNFFKNFYRGNYWTSTTFSSDPSKKAWFMYFYYGNTSATLKTKEFIVSCVRNAT